MTSVPNQNPPTILFLVRHGLTEWNHTGRLTGQADIGLNETGKDQVRHLARALRAKDADILYSSSLRRARETAAIIVAETGLEPIYDDRLREIDAGLWTGENKAALAKQNEESWKRWRDGERVAGLDTLETYTELQARVLDVFDELVSNHSGEHVIVVTHAGVIRVLLAAVLDRSFRDIECNDRIEPSSVTVFEHRPGSGYTVRAIGDRRHLTSRE